MLLSYILLHMVKVLRLELLATVMLFLTKPLFFYFLLGDPKFLELTEENSTILRNVLASIASVLSIIGVIITLYAYWKYNSTLVFKDRLIETGKENYKIESSCWKTIGCCWNISLFCGSITCWTQYCDNFSLFDCSDTSSRSTKKSGEQKPLNETSNSSYQSCNQNATTSSTNQFPDLVDIGREAKVINKWPYKDWKDQPFPESARECFNEMLNKCDEVEEGQFKKNFQKYSMATVCGGRMSHIAHCRSEICQKMKHSYYEGLGGLILEPIVYYVVIDWDRLYGEFKSK